jgi:hypothetical protein
MWAMGFEDVQARPDFLAFPDAQVGAWVRSMNDAHERAGASLVSFDELRRQVKLELVDSLYDDLFLETFLLFRESLRTLDELPATIFSSFVDGHDPWILPPLHIYASISAAVRHSNRTVRPHDALDFSHAASAIPYCDAFFCDNAMAAFLAAKPLELGMAYDTSILSRPHEILDYLNQIGR